MKTYLITHQRNGYAQDAIQYANSVLDAVNNAIIDDGVRLEDITNVNLVKK